MSTLRKTPTYNLKVVMQETGIKADTLRAWERRYGLPVPERTSGGHRLYSQYDIDTIKWLLGRQAEGMRINRAVKLWRSIEEDGREPLDAVATVGLDVPAPKVEVAAGETLNEIRTNWIAACLSFDESAAESILAQAFARFPLETVCLDVLRDGLSQIGDLWYQGESTVQQEHFASSLAIRRLDALIAGSPSPSRDGRILIGCSPGEDHVFPSLIATLFLRQRGWNVIYLGANVPVSDLEAAIDSIQPNLVILTAMQLPTAASLYEMAQYIQSKGIPTAYGGFVFSSLPVIRKHIPGHYLGDRLEDIIPGVERIMTGPDRPYVLAPLPGDYLQALYHFRDKQPLIYAHLWENVKRNGIKDYYLSIATEYLARDIDAALRLGDINYIQTDIDWLDALLDNYGVPVELLPKYLTYYKDALTLHMDERGQPIVEWISSLVD